MEFAAHQLQKIKLGVHIAQAVLIVVTWILEIVVFRSSAKIDGRLGWVFGLCFLSVIPLIFLTMTPRFPRTRKFANPYALATVDGLFCLLWLTAFACQANYNSSELEAGKPKCGDGCGRSKAVVGLGVFIWLLWALTTLMSLYGVVYYKREGYLPGASRAPHNAQQIDPDKEAFSTAPHDEYAPVHNIDDHDVLHDNNETAIPAYGANSSSPHFGSSSNSPYEGGLGGGCVPPFVHDENTSYMGYSGQAAPSYHTPGSVGSAAGRAQFPSASYNNV
ncbi:hypothetical protein BJ875DRAFT_272380 [Amylocarpus encephaloides]|uniref:MARVEL domain-containing protein n=1 Tax=Amylocarpus encephaloides TaxID=45428 RepID=A0A9P8C6M6_9HELO|nr:hypothetical protein BJ875DRAFT_272380 [Amylocarpus encephaloides]